MKPDRGEKKDQPNHGRGRNNMRRKRDIRWGKLGGKRGISFMHVPAVWSVQILN